MSVCLGDSLYVVSTGTYIGVVLCQLVSVTVSMLSLQVLILESCCVSLSQ